MESNDNIKLKCNNCGEFNFASSTYCSFCGELLSKNYFEILGISKYSDYNEIKRAYKKLSSMCHPDKTEHLSNDLKKLSSKKMLQLNEIWNTLKDDRKRQEYIISLKDEEDSYTNIPCFNCHYNNRLISSLITNASKCKKCGVFLFISSEETNIEPEDTENNKIFIIKTLKKIDHMSKEYLEYINFLYESNKKEIITGLQDYLDELSISVLQTYTELSFYSLIEIGKNICTEIDYKINAYRQLLDELLLFVEEVSFNSTQLSKSEIKLLLERPEALATNSLGRVISTHKVNIEDQIFNMPIFKISISFNLLIIFSIFSFFFIFFAYEYLTNICLFPPGLSIFTLLLPIIIILLIQIYPIIGTINSILVVQSCGITYLYKNSLVSFSYNDIDKYSIYKMFKRINIFLSNKQKIVINSYAYSGAVLNIVNAVNCFKFDQCLQELECGESIEFNKSIIMINNGLLLKGKKISWHNIHKFYFITQYNTTFFYMQADGYMFDKRFLIKSIDNIGLLVALLMYKMTDEYKNNNSIPIISFSSD